MKTSFVLLLLLFSFAGFTQYRFDNVAFKTIYWDELCQALKQNSDHLLLDVRSKGEHDDTSASRSLNIGHLKEAKNIDIREMGKRIHEIEDYKNKPVYVYCSHSQRSRRVSKMLADSGFANVVNINGGLSSLHMFQFNDDCGLLQKNLPYQIISPKALAQNKNADYFILDVRPDSAFKSITLVERRNALGKFKTAMNIPLSNLLQNLSSIPKDKQLLLVDEFGGESAAAAVLLNKNGFSKLAILFNGLDGYITEIPEKERTGWVNQVSYHTINSLAFDALSKGGDVGVVDIRTPEEFNNKSKETFRNIGTIKNAVNIPFLEFDKQLASFPADKSKPLVVYSMSSTPEVFEAAKKLSAQGYKNVNVLLGGLFNLRWRAANLKGHSQLKDWVVNVPADNL